MPDDSHKTNFWRPSVCESVLNILLTLSAKCRSPLFLTSAAESAALVADEEEGPVAAAAAEADERDVDDTQVAVERGESILGTGDQLPLLPNRICFLQV